MDSDCWSRDAWIDGWMEYTGMDGVLMAGWMVIKG